MSTTTVNTVLSRADTNRASAMNDLVSKTAPVRGILSSTVDITTLTAAERKGLLEGPKIDIYIGNKMVFRSGAVRAFMAWSPKANTYFRANPTSQKIVFREGAADPQAVVDVLKATITYYGMGGATPATVRMGTTTTQMVKLCQAGILLEMKNRIEHIYKRLKHVIATTLPPYEDLDAMLETIPASDSLFKLLATNLANRRFQKRIPDPEDFKIYLQGHVALKNAMDAIDATHQTERQAAREAQVAQIAQIKEERKWAAQKKHREREVRARVAVIKEKMNATEGGIVSLTREEAELKRELGF
ncbi:hypothetical protein GRF29_69g2029579 [Pseudopithomyces chartarum]|uniref:Uncharacterized protein n=1 Tax=Pseudopithomyces chartarum TaxID=1892770 RepID=A0AAN6LYI3_9PLEO|nr:hypothetical protein GRF29_69g2029579 [Pseudopithomyces chartarum]